jgi:hypothetical protein
MSKKIYKNTFAHHVENKHLTINQIIVGLHTRVFEFNKLPTKIQKAVTQKLTRHTGDSFDC